MKKLVFFFGFLLIAAISSAQINIAGTVFNSQTKAPIANVSILLNEMGNGTISNDAGEFRFRVDSLPTKISLRSLGFETTLVEIYTVDSLFIYLNPLAYELNEVTIYDSVFVKNLIQNIYLNVLEKEKITYGGKAFYRQSTFNDSVLVGIIESQHRAIINNNGIKAWEMLGAKYGKLRNNKQSHYFFIDNAMAITESFKLLDPRFQEPDIRFTKILQRRADAFYQFTITNKFTELDKEYYIIEFEPKLAANRTISPCWSGYMQVDANNFNIIYFKGQLKDEKQNVLRRTYENSVNDILLTNEIRFKETSDGNLTPEFLKTTVSYYATYRSFSTRVSVNATLLFYEYGRFQVFHDALMSNLTHDDDIVELRSRNADWQSDAYIPLSKAEIIGIELMREKGGVGNLLNETIKRK